MKAKFEIEPNTGRDCACFNLRKTTRAITRIYNAALRPCGLKATQFTVLMLAHHYPDLSVSKMAELMSMDRTTLTRNLRPLESQGLIAINPGAHGREKAIVLTDQGQQRLNQALPLWESVQQRIMDELGEKRLERLLEDLDQLTRYAG